MNCTVLVASILSLILAFGASASAASYCPIDQDSKAEADQASRTVRLRIKGLRSASCPALVRAALRKVAGVGDVTADLRTKIVTVDYDPGHVTTGKIQEVIKRDAGFESEVID